MNRAFAIAAILFCFELALFLVIVPWSSLWENNLLLAYLPGMRPIMLHVVVRSAVTGLGLLNLLIGVGEVRYLIHQRRR
jgi:hypothetical protein